MGPKYDPNALETHQIVEKMEKYGGSFVQALAILFFRADHINRTKIVITWENYFDEYAHIKPTKGK